MRHELSPFLAATTRTASASESGRAALALSALLCLALWLWPVPGAADEWNDSFTPPRAFVMNTTMPLHEGPSNGSPKLGPVDKGSIVFVSTIAKGWCRLQTRDGRNGYIFKRYLAPVEPAPDKTPPPKIEPKPEPKPEPKIEPKIEPKPEPKVEPKPEPEPRPKVEPVAPPQEPRVEIKPFSPLILPRREPARTEPSRPEAPLVAVAKPEPEPAAKPAPEPAPKKIEPEPAPKRAEPEPTKRAPEPAPEPRAAVILPVEDSAKTAKLDPKKENDPKPTKFEGKGDDDAGAQRLLAARELRPDPAPGRETLEEPLGRASGSRKALDGAGCSKYLPLRFGQGNSAATAENVLNSGGQDCYRFLSLKDHKLDIALSSTGGAVFDLYTPLSGQIVSNQAQCLFHTRSAGDKILVIKSNKDNTAYKLSLIIR